VALGQRTTKPPFVKGRVGTEPARVASEMALRSVPGTDKTSQSIRPAAIKFFTPSTPMHNLRSFTPDFRHDGYAGDLRNRTTYIFSFFRQFSASIVGQILLYINIAVTKLP
jgi:hypothetical protein